MTERLYLTDAQMGEYYIQANGPARPGDSPVDLESRIERWLNRSEMTHGNAFRIAIEVVKLAKPAPVATPEQAAWRQNQMDGISDQRPLTADDRLAARVQNMSMSDWVRERQHLGLHKDTLSFLSGA